MKKGVLLFSVFLLVLLVACQQYGQAVGRNLVRLSIIDEANNEFLRQEVSAKVCIPECGVGGFEQERSTVNGRVTFRNVPVTGTSEQAEFQIRDAKGAVLQSAPRFVYLSGTQRMQAKSVRVRKGAAPAPVRYCIDKDGANTMIKGATEGIFQPVSNAFSVYEDYCATDSAGNNKALSGDYVVEFLCQSSSSPYVASKVARCPYGCTDGKCNPMPAPVTTCSDTDGRDYAVRGVVTTQTAIGRQVTSSTHQDYCKDATTVVEYYCAGNTFKQEEYACPGVCVNGECQPPGATGALLSCTEVRGDRAFAWHDAKCTPPSCPAGMNSWGTLEEWHTFTGKYYTAYNFCMPSSVQGELKSCWHYENDPACSPPACSVGTSQGIIEESFRVYSAYQKGTSVLIPSPFGSIVTRYRVCSTSPIEIKSCSLTGAGVMEPPRCVTQQPAGKKLFGTFKNVKRAFVTRVGQQASSSEYTWFDVYG